LRIFLYARVGTGQGLGRNFGLPAPAGAASSGDAVVDMVFPAQIFGHHQSFGSEVRVPEAITTARRAVSKTKVSGARFCEAMHHKA
jgi:hypothetical protein